MGGEGDDIVMPELHATAKLFCQIDVSRILIDLGKPLPFADALRQAAGTEDAARRAQRGFGIPRYVFHLVPHDTLPFNHIPGVKRCDKSVTVLFANSFASARFEGDRSSSLRFVRWSTLCLVGVLCGCGSSSSSGPRWNPYPTPPPRDENYHGGQNALLLKYDANHDGTLTREELIAGLKAEFAGLDIKHTGCLTSDQVDAINQARIAADQSAATPLQDWNQDGCVDYREFSAAAYSLFDQLDKNGDGKITPQEFNPRVRPGTQTPVAPPQGRRRGGAPLADDCAGDFSRNQ